MSTANMTRAEWQGRAKETAARGEDLPQTKLFKVDIEQIRSAVRQREALRQHIRENLSNTALAKQNKVSVRCIERVVAFEVGGHIV